MNRQQMNVFKNAQPIKRNLFNLKLLLFSTISIFIISCSHTPMTQEYGNDSSALAGMSNFEHDIKLLNKEHADVLAPQSYANTENYYIKAKENIAQKGEEKDTLHYIAQGRAYLQQTQKFAKISQENLKDVINARNEAIRAKAPRLVQSEFEDADKNLRKSTSFIENNNLPDAI